MIYANPTTRGSIARKPNAKPFGFKRDLAGGGEWKNAVCPFHNDTHPSLRVRLDTGGFRCMVCGAHGGDVLAYHRLITGLPFIQAAQDLGAWEVTA